MFKRMLVLSLIGVLAVGAAVAVWGGPATGGPLAAVTAMLGGGGDHHEGHEGWDDDHDDD